MMASKRRYSIKKTVDRLRERLESDWFQKCCHVMPEADIVERLQKERLLDDDLYLIRLSLGYLASWYMATGGMSVLQGESSGWEDIRQGVVCECMGTRLHCWTMSRVPLSERSGFVAASGAMALMLALAMEEMQLAHQIAETLILGVAQSSFSKFSQIGFEPFALRLYGMSVGRELVQTGFDLPEYGDSYREVFEYWHDSEKLGTALVAVCDVHVECDRSPKGGGYSQFPHEPMGACPMEIAAIVRLRERTSLEIPMIRHPILNSRLASIPTHVKEKQEPLLERLAQRLRDVMPEIKM